MQVKNLKLQDENYGTQWVDEVLNKWLYDDFIAHRNWKEGWISFDCAVYYPENNHIYMGVTCFDENRIFMAYDRNAGQFVDLGYHRVAERFDAKFHRSLVRGDNGCLYAAPALLHCPDKYFQAPGASIIQYDPISGELQKLGIPLPHIYIQSLVIDNQRQKLYSMHLGPEYLTSFDLNTRQTQVLASLGSGYGALAQGQNIILDDARIIGFQNRPLR